MLGTLNYKQKKAVVIGAGISGLLIAYRLKQLGFQVEILEASGRTGGLIRTTHDPLGMVEHAAHSLLVNETLVPFFRELDLKLLPLDPKSKARYIVRNGKPKRMPLTTGELFSTLKHVFKKPRVSGNLESLTLEQWGHAYLGKSATQYLIAPFVTGVFACEPSDLTAKMTFPRLVPESKDLSLIQHFRHLKKKQPKPKSKMMVLEKGMQSLTEALTSRLDGQIQLNTPVESIASYLHNSNVILTTPADVTARLLENLDPKSSSLLSQVRYSPLVTITAFFESKSFQPHPPRGVGMLIPRSEPFRILGCLFNSASFSERVNHSLDTSITIMLGGTSDPKAIDLTDEEIEIIINDELDLLLGLGEKAKKLVITRWPRAIPLFDPSLQFARAALAEGFCHSPGRIIFSNYSSEVSVRGMIESLCQISPD